MPDDNAFDLARLGGERRKIPERGVVFLKGDAGHHAFVVVSGLVEIRGGGRAVEQIGPGEMFGELALIDGGPRSGSAVALEPTDVIAIPADEFHALIRTDPDFALYIMRMMAKRLRSVIPPRPSPELVAAVTPMPTTG